MVATRRVLTRRAVRLVAVVAAIALAAACEVTVRPEGTTFTPANGRIVVSFPAGAVDAPEQATIVGVPVDDQPGVVPGTGHAITPAVGWAQPVTVTLAYDPAALPRGVEEADLTAVRRVGDGWAGVAGATVDVGADRVAVATATLGELAVGWDGCDVRHPTTCTLAEAGAAAGVRIGTTLEPDEIDDPAYAATLLREHGSITPENAMKMYALAPQPGPLRVEGADAVVAFAGANDLEVRAHTLVWAQAQYTPAWVQAITDPTELRDLTDAYVGEVVDRYAGDVDRWDVVNEPLTTFGTARSANRWEQLLGPEWIAEVFHVAHAHDPDAELWLNEYGSDWVPGKHAALLALVEDLVADGVPIHGVGLQTHRPSTAGPDPATFEAQLRDFAELGLEVAITELDVATNPTDPNRLADQAAAYARIVRGCLAVPACTEITTWGITDADTWLDGLGLFPTPTRPLLFDEAFTPKPAYEAVRAALAEGRPPSG